MIIHSARCKCLLRVYHVMFVVVYYVCKKLIRFSNHHQHLCCGRYARKILIGVYLSGNRFLKNHTTCVWHYILYIFILYRTYPILFYLLTPLVVYVNTITMFLGENKNSFLNGTFAYRSQKRAVYDVRVNNRGKNVANYY